MNAPAIGHEPASFLLRFESLFDKGRAYSFPCDDRGHVTLDLLSERGRNNYLFARAVVGRDFAQPRIVQSC